MTAVVPPGEVDRDSEELFCLRWNDYQVHAELEVEFERDC